MAPPMTALIHRMDAQLNELAHGLPSPLSVHQRSGEISCSPLRSAHVQKRTANLWNAHLYHSAEAGAQAAATIPWNGTPQRLGVLWQPPSNPVGDTNSFAPCSGGNEEDGSLLKRLGKFLRACAIGSLSRVS